MIESECLGEPQVAWCVSSTEENGVSGLPFRKISRQQWLEWMGGRALA